MFGRYTEKMIRLNFGNMDSMANFLIKKNTYSIKDYISNRVKLLK